MKNLKGKVIYLIVTGAHKAKYIEEYCCALENEGANLWVMPTEAAKKIIPEYELFRIKHQVKDDYSKNKHQILPEEDLAIICPCTFNTLNKVALGIADNYPMSIIHDAIGKGIEVIIAPAMDYSLWNNFACISSREKLSHVKNIQVVFPEYIYNEKYKLEKTTMAPFEKILDSAIRNFTSIKYENYKLDDKISTVDFYSSFLEFKKIGDSIKEEKLTSGVAGFLAKRVKNGYLVTGTGAKIGDLKPEDMVYVPYVKNKVVYWEGKKCPTSEFPMIYEIFSEFSEMNVIVHSHCPSITYNPYNLKFITDQYISYGQWNETKKIKNCLVKNDGFAIMKLHGEISLGKDFEEALQKYGGCKR